MRLIVFALLAVAAASTAAGAPAPKAPSDRVTCADRITQVRDAAGQPRLDRSPAGGGDGLLIAAVDKRIDGCAVMQLHRRIDDLRPLPQPTSRPARLTPLRQGPDLSPSDRARR